MACVRWPLALSLALLTCSSSSSLRLCSRNLVERAGLISELLAQYSEKSYSYRSGHDLVNLNCRRNSSQIPDAWHMVRYDLPPSMQRKLRQSAPELCPLCRSGGGSGPTMFMTERTDGLGSRARQLLHVLALASFLQVDFGGIVPSADEKPHGVNVVAALDKLVGFDVSALRVGADSKFDVCFYSVPDFLNETLQHRCLQWPHRSSLMVASYDFLRALPVWNWEPHFLAQLRQHTPLRRLPLQHLHVNAPKVVLHVRRGDVVSHGTNPRNFPDEVYFHLAAQIRDILPQADMHVFSTTKEAEAPVDFFGYKMRDMMVHLDGDEVNDWAHMAQSDVLVLAPSSFSWVAGLLNEKCVLAFEGTEALPEWILHTGTLHSKERTQLRRCIEDRVFKRR